MGSDTADANTEFYNTFSQWAQGDFDSSDDIEQRLWALISSGQVALADVIQAIARLLASAVCGYRCKRYLLYFIEQLIDREQLKDPDDQYLGLFWVVHNSNLVFELDDISDVATISRILRDTGGAELLRSFLVVTLLSGDDTKRANAVKAFYPVGHTISTLKVVDRVLKNTQDFGLLNIFFHDASRLIPRDGLLPFSEDDRNYLRDLFSRGLSSAHPQIVETSQQALRHLS